MWFSLRKIAALGALVALLLLGATSSSWARSADCKPVIAVFYESSDWARLAQGLGADYSPCAQYYVTIPALAADKTQLVAGRAAQVRGYGPNFHALAEVNWNAWSRWVASTGNSWYQAGQQLRDRMGAAGFDLSTGDTWALNEFPSSVRTNGAARQQARDFVHGLYDGDGGPSLQGIVYVVGVPQNGLSIPTYKSTLESWLQDAPFWNDMSTYVSGFYQEVYGDVRNYAVSGVDPATRASLQNAYLQQLLSLATAPNAPPTVAAAKTFLQSAYGPLANASWGWTASYGWTQVTPDVMADYISAQTYAMRLGGESHIGFAWNPLNSTGLSSTDYANQIAAVLARLAGSIHETDGGDPTLACEATGCNATLPNTQTAPAWNTFATWTPTTAAFTTPPVTLTVGVPSGPIGLQLKTGSIATTLPFDSTVTIASTSPTGTFSTAPTGPFTPTLTLPLPAGSNSATIYAQDTTTGQPTFTTTLNGFGTATQIESIQEVPGTAPPPPPPPVTVTPVVYTPVNNHLHISFQLADANGQPLQGRVVLAVMLGTQQVASAAVTTGTDGAVSVTAFPQLALGCYSVKLGSVTVPGHVWDGTASTADYCVQTLPMSLGGITIGKSHGHVQVGVRVVDVTGHPLAANVTLSILRRGAKVASAAGHTAATGWYSLTASPKVGKGEACFSVQVRTVKAVGRTWDQLRATKYACLHG